MRVWESNPVSLAYETSSLPKASHALSICFAAIPGTDPKPNSSIFLAKERWTVKTRLKLLNRQPLESNQTFSVALNRVLGWHIREAGLEPATSCVQGKRSNHLDYSLMGWVTGLEPATARVTVWYSNHLSYTQHKF